ncbi:serine acetyltransferase [Pedobacter sp. MR2016-24]|uniref:serine acetyltransferase n=1 Tax=Pedobacter sp. MR2016-24 TaxID=2994466 RepID=UPI002247507D|nr:serine acetyltransferase [Pedobacter sp. MR2016-24]MCX2484236.1 serine acetyltransferase [Pedobacter sp. MR2016-24]
MSGIKKYVFQDWQANAGNPTKGKYIVVFYRLAQLIVRSKITKILFCWYLLWYRITIEWFMCVELSWNTKIGPNFQLWHGSGLVIHPNTIIGSNCSIRQCTTIGVRQGANGAYDGAAPIIGDFVDIGCNAVIIGNLTIGNHVSLGSGAIVVKSIADYSVAVGNPAKVIKVNIPEPATLI